MKLALNNKLIESYKANGKNPNYSLPFLLNSVDPRAFITITDAHEILGEGFTLDANKQPLQR